MLVFQFSSERRQQEIGYVPRNYFQDVVPELIPVARNIIRDFDQRSPRAAPETRNQFLDLISGSLAHVGLRLDGIREERSRNPIYHPIATYETALRNIGELLNRGEINPSNINFIYEIGRLGGVHRVNADRIPEIVALYENLPNHGDWFHRLVTEEIHDRDILQTRTSLVQNTLDISRTLFVGRNEFATSQARETFGRLLNTISGLSENDQKEWLRCTGLFTRNYGLGGLEFVEEAARRFGTSIETRNGIFNTDRYFSDRQAEFTVENAINTMQNLQQVNALNVELIRQRAAHQQIPANQIGGIVPENLREFTRLLVQRNTNLTQSLAEAQTTIHNLGLNENSLELRANFAYGITVLGRERAVQLYQSQGIENFARYTPITLQRVSENINNRSMEDSRPVFYLFMNSGGADHNNAFYSFSSQIESLTEGYRLVIVESLDAREFSAGAIRTAARHGTIEGFAVGGHGNPNSIQTGPDRDNPNHLLDLTDVNMMRLLLTGSVLSSGAVGVSIACNTGRVEDGVEPIGQLMSRALGLRIIAPDRNSGLNEFQFDQNHRIIGATFTDNATAVNFSQGSIR